MPGLVLAMALLVAPAVAAVLAGPASAADDPGAVASGCWSTPVAQTLEELATIVANQQRRNAQRVRTAPTTRSILALSNPDSRLKAAYGAGLLVGWGETGYRPDFSVVTAVGMSALVAPFAFLGEKGDRRIADLFACEAASFEEIAERAAAYIDAETLQEIARKHESGARLLVALPGSAARPETTWDLGAIAASRHPAAQRYIRSILLAAVDLAAFVHPATMPIEAGAVVERNLILREVGAGEPFLSAGKVQAPSATYLIHSGVLFPDEAKSYAEARQKAVKEGIARPHRSVVSAYDFFLAAGALRAEMHIASPRPYLAIRPQSGFDMSYIRALFLDTYRHGRMSREWRRSFVDRDASRYYSR